MRLLQRESCALCTLEHANRTVTLGVPRVLPSFLPRTVGSDCVHRAYVTAEDSGIQNQADSTVRLHVSHRWAGLRVFPPRHPPASRPAGGVCEGTACVSSAATFARRSFRRSAWTNT